MNQLTAAGVAVGELWRMPSTRAMTSISNPVSPISSGHHADDAESGDGGHMRRHCCGSSSVEDRPWAHLDIAGREFAAKDRATCPAGGTGYAVQLLEQLVAKAEGAI